MPPNNYAMLLNMAKRYQDGSKPLDHASPAVRKLVISGPVEDPGKQKQEKPKSSDKPDEKSN